MKRNIVIPAIAALRTWWQRHRAVLAVVAVLLLGLWWRTYRLTISPPALAPDEIDYALTAKAVAWFGRDLTLTRSIWALRPFVYNVPMGELTPLYQIFTQGWLPSSIASAKIMPVVYSCLVLLGTYQLVYLLWRRRRLALLAMAVLAVNPWAIFIGRTAYDGPVALCLFIWSWVCLFYAYHTRTRGRLVGFLFGWYVLFAWGFFTYHGLKIAGALTTLWLLVYLVAREWPAWHSRLGRTLSVVALVLVTLIGNAVVIMRTQMRTDELSVFNFAPYVRQSDNQRRLNLAPASALTRVLDNSRFIWWSNFWERYADIYDPKVWFFTGVLVFQLSVWGVGEFWVFESVALAGGVYLLVHRRQGRELVFCLGWLLAAPVTYALKSEASNWVYQNCLLLPAAAVIIALAWEALLGRWRRLAAGGLVLLYAASMVVFGHNYFDRYPVYAEEQWYLRERLLAHYLRLASQQPILIITDKPWDRLRDYVFYNQIYTRQTAPALAALLATGQESKHWDNLTWSGQCGDLASASAQTTIVLDAYFDEACAPLLATHSAKLTPEATAEIDIVALKDSGANYRIYNDRLCDPASLPGFSLVQNRSDFNIEAMAGEEFCRKWLVKFFNAGP